MRPPYHVALMQSRVRSQVGSSVEVSLDSFGGEIGAPFEEAALDCFEECCDARAAHRLMGKLDAVGLGLDGVGEQTQINRWGVS